MDIVYVRGLEVKTVIGVYEWEREIKQPVTVDLDMAYDIARAAATDTERARTGARCGAEVRRAHRAGNVQQRVSYSR